MPVKIFSIYSHRDPDRYGENGTLGRSAISAYFDPSPDDSPPAAAKPSTAVGRKPATGAEPCDVPPWRRQRVAACAPGAHQTSPGALLSMARTLGVPSTRATLASTAAAASHIIPPRPMPAMSPPTRA